MARHRRRHHVEDISWPPRDDDVEVMDFESALQDTPVDLRRAEDVERREQFEHTEEVEVRQSEQQPHMHEEAVDDGATRVVLPHARLRVRRRKPSTGIWPQVVSRFRDVRSWVTPQRLALLVLAALVTAQAIYIGTRMLNRSVTAAPGRPGSDSSAAAAGTAGRHSSTAAVPGAGGSPTDGGDSGSGAAPATSGATAYLAIRTQPAGGTVYLDGKRLGVAPATVPGIEPGQHRVRVYGRTGSVEHEFTVTAGEVVSLVIPLAGGTDSANPAPSEGSLSVEAPVELRILDGDRLLGTSAMDRVPVTPGTHRLHFSNDSVGFEQERSVKVSAGKTTTIRVEMPDQPVAMNAIPWAEVWVDGRRVGETPIGALPLALGSHVVVFRHPQFGEKSVKTVVRANEPARIGVDMRK